MPSMYFSSDKCNWVTLYLFCDILISFSGSFPSEANLCNSLVNTKKMFWISWMRTSKPLFIDKFRKDSMKEIAVSDKFLSEIKYLKSYLKSKLNLKHLISTGDLCRPEVWDTMLFLRWDSGLLFPLFTRLTAYIKRSKKADNSSRHS